MVTRSAGGRPNAVSALGLLVAWAVIGVTGAVHAQQFDERDEFRFAGDESIAPHDPFGDDELLGCSCADCGSYRRSAFSDSCCECQTHAPICPCTSCPGGQIGWFGAEYLVWQIDGSVLPPLVTDSPIGTDPVLGSPTTSTLAGGNDVGDDWRSGYRLRAGAWLDVCHSLALTGDYFQLGGDDYDYFFAGDPGRPTARPYFNTQTGMQTTRLISDPGLLDGTVSVTTDDDFQGAGLAIEQCVYSNGVSSWCSPGTQVFLLGGYRYYSYDSRLAISDSVTTLSGPDISMKHDEFATNNEFHGGEIGVQARLTQDRYWFDGVVKLAIGAHHRSATIDGETVTIPDGMAAETAEGGLLTSSETNIGFYSSDSRARVIPELRLGIGAYLSPNWTMRAGYNLIVWGGVARAAGRMPPNLAVDERNIPPVSAGGGASPRFPGIGGSELVAHGIDLGLQFAY